VAGRLVAVLLCALLALSASHAQRPTLRVLFIGNSYTYHNNVGDLVSGIAAALRGGPSIASRLAVQGGMPLGWHLEHGPAMAMLATERWDHVVLQEHSLLGGHVIAGEPRMAPPELFHASARTLVRRVREHEATPLLFMTWPRRDRPAEEPLLGKAYLDVADELGVAVAPVGFAWTTAIRRAVAADLYSADGAHPSPAGSYLAACVLYAALTGLSPSGAPAVIEGSPYSRTEGAVDTTRRVRLVSLPVDVAAQLQQIAWDTVSASRSGQVGLKARLYVSGE
jgi:hypothetical protein